MPKVRRRHCLLQVFPASALIQISLAPVETTISIALALSALLFRIACSADHRSADQYPQIMELCQR